MRNFNYKRRNLASGPHLLGLLLILAGIFALFSPLLFKSEVSMGRVVGIGIGAIFMGRVIVTTYRGTIIDFAQRKYKDYQSLGGYKFGNWSTLPDISKVKLISTSAIVRNTPNGVSPTLSGKVTNFKALIYANSTKPLFSFEYSNREKAEAQAKQLAADLNATLELNNE